MKKRVFSIIKAIAFCIAISPLIGISSAGGPNEPAYRKNPNYLLDGQKVAETNDYYDYYQLKDSNGNLKNEYAVALKSSNLDLSGKLRIPEKHPTTKYPVTGIWRNGFAKSKCTDVVFTDNINTIDYEAFLGCDFLRGDSKTFVLTIPYTILQIGDGAFYNCRELRKVHINNSADSESEVEGTSACNCEEPEPEEEEVGGEEQGQESIASSDQDFLPNVRRDQNNDTCQLTIIPAFCFFGCKKMTELILPSRIAEIKEEAFNGCINLSTTLAFQSIRQIRSRAFQGCVKLRIVYIQSDFFNTADTTIEAHAFNYCSPDLKFYFAGDTGHINSWISSHPNWGWYSDYGDPAENSYTYDTNTLGSAALDGDWLYTTNNGLVTITKYIGPVKRKNAQGEDVDITYITFPDHLPLNSTNEVAYIKNSVFDSSLKNIIQRIYLPKYLRIINNDMFGTDYDALTVVDDNTQCSGDAKSNSIIKKINLSNLKKLELIGDRAFVNMDHLAEIEKLHLPSGLIGIGSRVFGTTKNQNGYIPSIVHMNKVTDFQWDYVESEARLKFIGEDSFYKLGADDPGTTFKSDPKSKPHPSISNSGTKNYKPMTLILPSTFQHTGITSNTGDNNSPGLGFSSSDKTKLNNAGYDETYYDQANYYKDAEGKTLEYKNKDYKGEHVFGGCPLIGTVIIKGSSQEMLASNTARDPNVTDLVLGSQTFAYNDSLRTIIIEERKGHSIYFNTQSGKWVDPCIGWNAGKRYNDLSGDPSLQTLILPNKYTKLKIQHYAFMCNSRAVIYLTGKDPETGNSSNDITQRSNFYLDTAPTVKHTFLAEFVDANINGISKTYSYSGDFITTTNNVKKCNAESWNLIGNEKFTKAKVNGGGDQNYTGYCFSNNPKYEEPGDDKNPSTTAGNTFGLDQRIPIYTGIHYENDFISDNGETVSVNIGDSNSAYDLKIETEKAKNVDGESVDIDKYAFVCDNSTHKATLSKYLYDRLTKEASQGFTFDGSVAHIPETVDNYDSVSCEVNEIGASAFSAAYNDNNSNRFYISVQDKFKDLSEVEIPDTIEKIGDYAFMRAYGVTKLSTYTKNGNNITVNDYTMPSNLEYIGKHAFAFCNIKEFLSIPNDCIFFENIDHTNKIKTYESSASSYDTSVFSNNFSLRKITFVDSDGAETNDSDTYSNYYITTTYSHTGLGNGDANDTYTSAIYSRAKGVVDSNDLMEKNDDRLLLVLYRTGDDETKESEDFKKVKISGVFHYQFAGDYKENQYLYGAFKMGYWIDCLAWGSPTKENSTLLKQPLFSGVRIRRTVGNNYVDKDSPIYLGESIDNYSQNIADLNVVSISGNNLDIPDYSFYNCSNYKFRLPQIQGITIPKGAFANNSQIQFLVPIDAAASDYAESTTNVIDLTYTKYAGIGEETFKRTGVTKFIAPIDNGEGFEIGPRAFQGCDNLEEIDLSNVTGPITIDANAFSSLTVDGEPPITYYSKLKKIDCHNASSVTIKASAFAGSTIKNTDVGFVWPASSDVTFESSAFSGCTFESGTFKLPNGLKSIGANCFYNCSTLSSVTADMDLDKLTTIGNNAFEGCTGINAFPFDKMTKLTTIGTKAFYTGSNEESHPSLGGVVDIPSASLSSIGAEAFENSKITQVHVSSTALYLGKQAFKNCTSLTMFYFRNPACTLTGAAESEYFANCSALEELWLPSNGLKLNNNLSTSMIEGATSGLIRVYSHQSYGATLSTTWREYTGGPTANITYYVANSSSLINGSAGSYSLKSFDSSVEFWTYANNQTNRNNVIILGNPSSVDIDTGDVTFDSGYVLKLNGTVINPNIVSISITVDPTKTTYSVGEDLDLSGMVVTATLSDSTTIDVTNYVTLTGYDKDTAGNQTVTVSYSGQSDTFDATVGIVYTIDWTENWVWNGNCELFAWVWGGDYGAGQWVEVIKIDDNHVMIILDDTAGATGFKLVRCVNGTTTPDWNQTGDNLGRIYNKTDNIIIDENNSYSTSWVSHP